MKLPIGTIVAYRMTTDIVRGAIVTDEGITADSVGLAVFTGNQGRSYINETGVQSVGLPVMGVSARYGTGVGEYMPMKPHLQDEAPSTEPQAIAPPPIIPAPSVEASEAFKLDGVLSASKNLGMIAAKLLEMNKNGRIQINGAKNDDVVQAQEMLQALVINAAIIKRELEASFGVGF